MGFGIKQKNDYSAAMAKTMAATQANMGKNSKVKPTKKPDVSIWAEAFSSNLGNGTDRTAQTGEHTSKSPVKNVPKYGNDYHTREDAPELESKVAITNEAEWQ